MFGIAKISYCMQRWKKVRQKIGLRMRSGENDLEALGGGSDWKE